MTDRIEFSPRRLGHVNLYVSDLERTVAFYEELCGLHLVRREPGIRAAFHSNGNTHHDIGLIEVSKGQDRIGRDGRVQIAATRGTRASLNHLGWEMENEAQLVAAYTRLKNAGGSVYRVADHLISHSVYIDDPDGNTHEFYADAIPDWREVFNPQQEDLVTSQWDPLAQAPMTQAHYPVDPVIAAVPGAPLQPRRITGVAMATSRFEEMERFFSDVGGLAPAREPGASPHRRTVFISAVGDPALALTEVPAGEPAGLRMFSFRLLSAPAIEPLRGILDDSGLPAPRLVEDGQRSAVVVTDPDGFAVEFYHPRETEALAPLAA